MSITVEQGARWKMYLADCRDVMPLFEAGSIDSVVCDPPYEVEAHTKARRALKDATQKRGRVNRGEVRRIDQPLEISFEQMTEGLRCGSALEFGRLARRWVVVFCQIEGVAAWRAALAGGGLEWVRGGIWRKPDGAPQFTGDRPGQGFECLAIAHPPGRKRWHGGGKHAVWTCALEHGHGGGKRYEHPTTKPTALMIDLVRDFTDPDETVLDAFAGSGMTGVACLRLGRRFIGIEKDEKYFDLACERLRAEVTGSTLAARRAGQGALFGGSTG